MLYEVITEHPADATEKVYESGEKEFRTVMGRFATGITVITSYSIHYTKLYDEHDGKTQQSPVDRPKAHMGYRS